MKTGKQIRKFRLSKDISADQLAKRLKITSKHLRRIERGEHGLSEDVARRLQAARKSISKKAG